MNVRVDIVTDKSQLGSFVQFPYHHYRLDENFVPPLIGEQMKLLNTERNIFWRKAERCLFLAYDADKKIKKVIGRIAAIVDNNYNEYYKKKTGYFGFFETENHPDISNALFDAAIKWLKEKGMEDVIGPMNPSINDMAGLLVDAFNQPPVLMMPYNPKYYVDFIEGYGFKKVVDLYAYHTPVTPPPEKLACLVPKLEKRGKFTIRKFNMKNLYEEVEIVRELYNKFLVENYAFVPITKEEFISLANELKMIADPDLLFMAEVDGKAVGCSITLPDMNQVLIKMNGRLFPFGIFKFLHYRKKIDGLRVIVMGVIEEYRKRGIDLAFYYHSFKNAYEKGYKNGEMSWIREDNIEMIKILDTLDAKIYKTYRLYKRDL